MRDATQQNSSSEFAAQGMSEVATRQMMAVTTGPVTHYLKSGAVRLILGRKRFIRQSRREPRKKASRGTSLSVRLDVLLVVAPLEGGAVVSTLGGAVVRTCAVA